MSINKKNKIGRNEDCPCQSGMKYKHCHGDQAKMMQCKAAANERMLVLIQEEKIRRGLVQPEVSRQAEDDAALEANYNRAAEKVCKK